MSKSVKVKSLALIMLSLIIILKLMSVPKVAAAENRIMDLNVGAYDSLGYFEIGGYAAKGKLYYGFLLGGTSGNAHGKDYTGEINHKQFPEDIVGYSSVRSFAGFSGGYQVGDNLYVTVLLLNELKSIFENRIDKHFILGDKDSRYRIDVGGHHKVVGGVGAKFVVEKANLQIFVTDNNLGLALGVTF